MPRRLRVALLIESSRASGRGLLGGIASYVRTHGPWSVYHYERALGDAAPVRLHDWRPDGIIARVESRRLIRLIEQWNVPTVDVLGWYRLEGIPQLGNDRRAIARMAAEYLLERGLEHFAYCGFPGLAYSDQRGDHFADYLQNVGRHGHIYRDSHSERRSHPSRRTNLTTTEAQGLLQIDELAAWLHDLPKPVGLLACNDIRAQQVLSACSEHGIAVPDRVAVIGVDNDEVLCEMCDPPLTSIELNNRRIGYEAAAQLERMIRGEPVPTEKLLVPPVRVVSRASTDLMAVADSDVAAAIHFIREHACEGICVEDVLAHVAISASSLKRRFAASLGRSPKAEILRVQLERVKHLLRSTNLPLAKVAELAGFQHVEWMCKLFKKKTCFTAGQFRKDAQG
jgi:LacI family transcriptional regulator